VSERPPKLPGIPWSNRFPLTFLGVLFGASLSPVAICHCSRLWPHPLYVLLNFSLALCRLLLFLWRLWVQSWIVITPLVIVDKVAIVITIPTPLPSSSSPFSTEYESHLEAHVVAYFCLKLNDTFS